MIARYTLPEMGAVWENRHRYRLWLQVELAACEEMARGKLIPSKDWLLLKRRCQDLLRKGGVDPERVDFHESLTRHDVIAFTTAVAERIGPVSRYIHFGLTSSDVVDTALSLQMLEAGELLRKDIEALLETLERQALKYRDLPTIGRTHGIFAEPTSFGLKFLGWYCEWRRNLERLDRALDGLRVGKLSGAVGANAHWAPVFESKVLSRLGLRREEVSTQVIPRDRHAEFMNLLAICGCSIERIAVELRHLQRTEVGEVLESFGKSQRGSSAMPHKRNPISSENLTGCARLLRAYALPSLENIALWHERDISHSSAERVALADGAILLDYALNRLNRILTALDVRETKVRENLSKAGPTVFSGHVLLALVKKGASREQAYAWVQECALGSFEGKGEFLALLGAHPEIRKRLSTAAIRELGSLKFQLRNVPAVYRAALARARKKRPIRRKGR
ncbi:MAG: adenylosuccinate lyase [Oligoflexia bacterium]|nr:adenylosuccinate lyase [Oligoflexia bacterium]